MSAAEKNTNDGKSKDLFPERDVLGIEKTKGSSTTTPANPNRIFIVVGCLIVIAIIYWFYTH